MPGISTANKISLYERIFNRIYLARNISLDNKTILDCLLDIDRISNRYNDHNGQMSDANIRKQSNKVLNELAKKYNIL